MISSRHVGWSAGFQSAPPWIDQHRAGPVLDDLLADLCTDDALHDHGVFILIAMRMDGASRVPVVRVLQRCQLAVRSADNRR
jgi:hypothetical protein